VPRKAAAKPASATRRDHVYAITPAEGGDPEIVVARYFRVSGGSLTLMIGVDAVRTRAKVYGPGTWRYMEEIEE